MSEKTREICTIVSQESIGAGIYSMWIQTDKIAVDAKPGQFVSLYTNDKSKILPRPISLCEIDKENKRLHLVYRVTGPGTGTDEFSKLKAGDMIPVLGPLGNGFPVEKAQGKNVFLMGGDRVVMIEDVTTSGKSMEETVPKVKGAANVEIVGLMVSLDRMEVGKGGVKCALDEVHDLYGFETNAIVTMQEVIEHLYNKEYKGKVIIDDTLKAAIDAYYEQYGAK